MAGSWQRWGRRAGDTAWWADTLRGARVTAPASRAQRRTRPPFSIAVNPFAPLLRHRNFRIFWSGQTLSLVGTWMQVMAEGWLALELTNNAFLVTLVTAVGAIPVLALSLL